MKPKFEVVFLEPAATLALKPKAKIYYTIDKAKLTNDPKLFKKLEDEIWEFRTKYAGLQYRLFAFWDKTDKTDTLVLATSGIVKKTNKIPKADIEKAKKIRTAYFAQKD